MAINWTHLSILLLITTALTSSTCARMIRDRLQAGGAFPEILRRLGLQREGLATLDVSVGPYNQGESPIYYIKLPPSPYFFKHHQRQPHTEAPAETSSLPKPTKIDVNFVNNGKPSQVYHWNLPLTSASHLAFESLKKPSSDPPTSTPAPVSTTTTSPSTTTSPTTTTRLTTTLATTKLPQDPQQPYTIPDSFWPTPKVPHVLKKKYYYNGKPSNVYVWRPKQRPVAVAKHPYFQHFNY